MVLLVSTVLRPLHPLLSLYSRAYFALANTAFWVWNVFRTRRVVLPPDNELLLISASDAARLIRLGELSSFELVEAYVSRVREVNPALNAMVEENFEEALKAAREIDDYVDALDKDSAEYSELPLTKPLLGVPFTVKDNAYTKGHLCTAGVPARKRANQRCDLDSEAVHRLKEAGAILLGVSNVPELALWWETSNSIYGTTYNPYDLRRTPGGSSGGEAALISACASVIGVANDVGGSLRIPPAFTGLFGLKPGPGLVPPAGLYPAVREGTYVAEMATAGPICRYAKDLGVMMKVLVGPELAEKRLHLHQPANFRRCRIFYMEGVRSLLTEPTQTEQLGALRKAVKYFERKYDLCSYRLDLPLIHHAVEMFIASFDRAEFPRLAECLANFEGDVNCWWELAKWGVGLSEHTLPAILTALHNSHLPDVNRKTRGFVESKRNQLRREIIELLRDDGLLLFPASPTMAPYCNQPLLTPFNFVYSALWNALALPVVVCPMGLDKASGLPLGVQIVGAPDSEGMLIAAAQELEDGFGGWVGPPSLHSGRFGYD